LPSKREKKVLGTFDFLETGTFFKEQDEGDEKLETESLE